MGAPKTKEYITKVHKAITNFQKWSKETLGDEWIRFDREGVKAIRQQYEHIKREFTMVYNAYNHIIKKTTESTKKTTKKLLTLLILSDHFPTNYIFSNKNSFKLKDF